MLHHLPCAFLLAVARDYITETTVAIVKKTTAGLETLGSLASEALFKHLKYKVGSIGDTASYNLLDDKTHL